MKKLSLIILSAFALSMVARADMITVFSTGTTAPGVTLPDGSVDPHYTLTSGPIVQPYPANSYVSIGTATLPYLHNDSNSKWISPTQTNDVNTVDPIGVYTYITQFVLPPGFSNAMLSGQWLSDNPANMLLNGNLVSMTPNSNDSFQMWTPFTISSGFMAGLNTLEFDVTNTFGPSGMRVEFFTASFTAVPDTGSSVALLGGALLALGIFRRSRGHI